MKTLIMSVLTTAFAAALFLPAAPAVAQAPGIDLRVNPRIGLYQPLTDLDAAGDAAAETAGDLSGSLALGLGAELDLALLPVGVRFNLDYATGSEVSYTEDGGVATAATDETTLLALVGDVMFRPLPRLIIAQPYFFAGGGLKQYDFEPTEGATQRFEDESDWTVHVGGGLDVGLGPLSLNAELGDYISWWEVQEASETGDTEMQHDLFVTIGFSMGLL